MMKKVMVMACMVATVALASGQALAESIKGRVGGTARIGFIAPNDNDSGNFRLKTDIGVIGGGGFIYGVDDNWAAEFDITHAAYGSDLPLGGNGGDFSVTTLGFNGQYRFSPTAKLVPYVGAGLDVFLPDFEGNDVDTTVGVHVAGGIDYFLMKSLAVTAEVKAVLAAESDIKARGNKIGNYDPSNITTTFGVRFFFF